MDKKSPAVFRLVAEALGGRRFLRIFLDYGGYLFTLRPGSLHFPNLFPGPMPLSAPGPRYAVLSALLTHLCEALAAVDGAVALGLEGNPGLAAAGGADRREVLPGTAGSVPSLTVITLSSARRRWPR